MVAESTLTASPVPKPRAKSIPLAFHARLKARNLYVGQGLSHQQIADRTGLTAKQVANLVAREKLFAVRQRREKGIESATDTQAHARLEAFNAQLAEEAEEISLGAIARAREEVERGDKDSPRNFQSYTGGILNLVKASRTVRGLDQKGGAQSGESATVIFIGALERVGMTTPKELKAALPAIEVSALPVAAIPDSAQSQ